MSKKSKEKREVARKEALRLENLAKEKNAEVENNNTTDAETNETNTETNETDDATTVEETNETETTTNSKENEENTKVETEDVETTPVKTETDNVVNQEYLGKILFYKQRLGFGFIKFPEIEGETQQPDMFLHFSDIPDETKPLLKPEVQVKFDVGKYTHINKDNIKSERIKAINIEIVE